MATKAFLSYCVLALCMIQFAFGQHVAAPTANIADVLDPQFQNATLLYAKAAPNDNPFLINDFLSADIYMKNNKTIKDVQVKYDIERQLLYANDNGRYVILNTDQIDHFNMTLPGAKEKSKFLNVNDQFFEALSDAEINLLKKTMKARQRKTEANSTGYNDEGARPSAYRQSESYYLLKPDGLHDVRLTKKSILKALGDSRYEDCAKINDLKLNQIEDIITLLKECK